jgi:hypothetical protein
MINTDFSISQFFKEPENRETLGRVALRILAIACLILGIGAFFSGTQYFPNFFSISWNRIGVTVIFGAAALGCVILSKLDYHCFKKKASPKQADVKEHSCNLIYYESCTLPDGSELFLMAKGGADLEGIKKDFMENMEKKKENLLEVTKSIQQKYNHARALISIFRGSSSAISLFLVPFGGFITIGDRNEPTLCVRFIEHVIPDIYGNYEEVKDVALQQDQRICFRFLDKMIIAE